MTRLIVMLGLVAGGAFVAACGSSQPPAGDTAPAAPAAAAPTAGAARDLTIAFASTPAPPKTGENRFEVAVMDENGRPVTDASVSAEFYMAAMPQMNMREMRNRVELTHEGSGRYTGTGMVLMAGSGDVTVTVSRGGQPIDSETLSVTAQ